MSFATKLFGFFTGGGGASMIDKGLEIALERTEDVDKRNALVMNYLSMKEETRRVALNRVTLPWVDALHKMARPILAALAVVCVSILVAVCALAGKVDELLKVWELVAGSIGLGGLYTVLKGRGR